MLDTKGFRGRRHWYFTCRVSTCCERSRCMNTITYRLQEPFHLVVPCQSSCELVGPYCYEPKDHQFPWKSKSSDIGEPYSITPWGQGSETWTSPELCNTLDKSNALTERVSIFPAAWTNGISSSIPTFTFRAFPHDDWIKVNRYRTSSDKILIKMDKT